MSRLIDQTEHHLKSILDIRTIMRMQSIQLAIVRILFKTKHYPLLNLQRKGNLLDLENYIDDAERLIYGDRKKGGAAVNEDIYN